MKLYIKLFVITLFIFGLSSCGASQKQDSLQFTGTLKGYGDGVIKIQFYGPKEITKDSIIVTNDKFEYTKKLESPRQAFILINANENLKLKGKHHRIDYFMENSEINLSLNIDDIDNHTITGSKTEDEYQQIRKSVGIFAKDFSKARQEYSKSKSESKDSLKLNFEQATDKYLSALKNNKLFLNSDTGPYLLWLGSRYISTDKLAELLIHFDSSLKNNIYLKYITNKVEGANRVKPGKLAPNFVLKDFSGKEYTMDNFKGNYLLMDFEASWCKPCKIEIPFLKESHEKYSDKGLTIISVNLDVTRELWEKDMTTENLPWQMLSDLQAFDGELTKNYGITSIPRIFLIDPDGKIVSSKLRGEKILKKLEEVYGN